MWSFRNQLNFDKDLAENHRINVLLGTEFNSETIESKDDLKIGYDPMTLTYENSFDWNSVRAVNDYSGQLVGTAPYYLEVYEKDRFVSFYGNAGYHFSNRYSVSLSGRIDKSNLFGASADYKKNILWSTGFAWNIHKEKFFDSRIINRLTFRGTYGVNGNIDKNDFSFNDNHDRKQFYNWRKNFHCCKSSKQMVEMGKNQSDQYRD